MLTLFQEAHFNRYRAWFSDPDLERFLGPIDEDWLDAVLHESDGAQYAFLEQQTLLGVIGIKFPTPAHPYYVLTDIAIAPEYQKKGLGRKLLAALYQRHPVQEAQYWLCYVDKENRAAHAFFRKQGWHEAPTLSDTAMLAYRYPSACT